MSMVPATALGSYGPKDIAFADALKKVSPQAQTKAKKSAQDFEAVFINTMFSEMTSGLKGEGPFGDTVGTGAWRSMLTDQYARSFAKSGGVGIASDVYRSLIMQQAARSSTTGSSTNVTTPIAIPAAPTTPIAADDSDD